MSLCHGLDAKVSKLGIGFPMAQELNGILINLGAEESGSTAGAEAASTKEGRLNASLRLKV